MQSRGISFSLSSGVIMKKQQQIIFWLCGVAVFLVSLHFLSEIMLPFVAGMAIAYFLDPVADWLEQKKITRTLAAVLILFSFFVLAAAILMMLFPLLQRQIVELFAILPEAIETLRLETLPWLMNIFADLPPDTLNNIRSAAKEFAGGGLQWVSKFASNLLSSGMAFFNLLSLIIITPVVAFYLLRDWDLITHKIDSWLPRRVAPTIREQLSAINQTLAAFVRGQLYVCLALGIIYGGSLTIFGLNSGLLLGLVAGLISFIPYFGAAVGLAAGLLIAFFQFSEWMPLLVVASIFIIGQTIESYILTPRLVGEGIGLHPVWIIFALLAGGSLFGFTGVLLAVPIAAIIGVLSRFLISQYLNSPLYDDRGNIS